MTSLLSSAQPSGGTRLSLKSKARLELAYAQIPTSQGIDGRIHFDSACKAAPEQSGYDVPSSRSQTGCANVSNLQMVGNDKETNDVDSVPASHSSQDVSG